MKTNQSLIENAKLGSDSEAWFQLHRIYDPLITGWVVRAGVDRSDVNDITQEVLAALAEALPTFEHNGRVGAFRNWLKSITLNRCRRYWDAKKKQVPTLNPSGIENGLKFLAEFEDQRSDTSRLWDQEHDSYVLKKLIDLIRNEFAPEVFEIFLRGTLREETAQSISKSEGLAITKVYKIRFKVMTRLRQLAAGLLDDVSI